MYYQDRGTLILCIRFIYQGVTCPQTKHALCLEWLNWALCSQCGWKEENYFWAEKEKNLSHITKCIILKVLLEERTKSAYSVF